jgi:hypothetical protein
MRRVCLADLARYGAHDVKRAGRCRDRHRSSAGSRSGCAGLRLGPAEAGRGRHHVEDQKRRFGRSRPRPRPRPARVPTGRTAPGAAGPAHPCPKRVDPRAAQPDAQAAGARAPRGWRRPADAGATRRGRGPSATAGSARRAGCPNSRSPRAGRVASPITRRGGNLACRSDVRSWCQPPWASGAPMRRQFRLRLLLSQSLLASFQFDVQWEGLQLVNDTKGQGAASPP